MVSREERGRGVPLDDTQRVARHYGITIEEARALLEKYSPQELLPERGYGLTASREIVGYTVEDFKAALNTMESSLPEGGQARVQLFTGTLPDDDSLAEFYIKATAAGHHISYPTAGIVEGVPTTEFSLQKGSPEWAALIPLIPTVLVVGLIAFGIVRIEAIARAILPIAITVVVGIVVLAGIARSERLGTKYLERIPETRKKALAAR